MHLTSLTIRGFKSFASATTFTFDEGLSAIVGPNGAGKSNVVDALAWVLGEQGSKNLRGGSMQDVIFAGAGQRPALGRAKVSLTIDNSDGQLNVPASEVEISRTMFSSGGSEYQLNGEPVRLSDIQELFATAGLGKNLHVLVGQGQLDQLLYASSDQRRVLLEEAAGINKHRRRQDKTARKLESMRENLTRVEDIVRELERQLEPLGEQAESAREASNIQAKIRELQSLQLAVETKELSQQLENISEKQSQLQETFDRLTAENEDAQKREGATEQVKHDIQASLRLVEQRIQKLVSLETQVSGLIDLAAERALHRHVDLTPYVRAVEQAQMRVKKIEEDVLDGVVQREESAQVAFVQRLKSELASAELKKASDAVLATRNRAQVERQHRAQLTENLAAQRAQATRAEAEVAEHTQELHDAQKLQRSAHEVLSKHRVSLADAQQKVTELEKLNERALGTRVSARNELEKIRKQHADLTTQEAAQIAEKATLKRALAGKGSQAAPAKANQLYTYFSVIDGWDKAVAVALGDSAEAYVVPSPAVEDTESLAVSLAFEPLTDSHKTPKIPANARSVLDVIDADAKVEPIVRAALENYVLVESIEDARTCLDVNPHLVAITREGIRVSSWSIIYPAASGSAVQLHKDFENINAHLENTQIQLLQITEELKDAEENFSTARSQEKDILHRLGAAHSTVETLQREGAALESRLSTIDQQLKRHHHLVESAKQRASKAQQELETTLSTLKDNQPKIIDIEPLETAEKNAQQRAYRAQTALDLAESRAQVSFKNLQRMFVDLAQARKEFDRATIDYQEASDQQQQKSAKADRAAAAQEKASKLLEAIHSARSFEETTYSEYQRKIAHRVEEDTQEASERNIRQAKLSALATEISEYKVQRARLETKFEDLDHKAFDISGQSALDMMHKHHESLENFDSEQTLLTTEKLRRQLQELGAVNPLALEEYEALSQRYRFMSDQLTDLKASRSDLRAIMKDVNTHIADLFGAVFTEVKSNYEAIFPRLFPGGEGTLVLTDAGNLLDTGIEVHARPAGKKVKRLSLLSGGERSLASLALLIAIFMARPAPFYVLDEVEAALDDRNLSRLLEVLAELSTQSQLIVITHKTRTMESADTLYGIAMKDGVSSVVSQKVEQLRELLD